MSYQRPPAPAELLLIESFCDSAAFLHGWDAFADQESARAWLSEHGRSEAATQIDAGGVARLVDVRETVRGHLDGDPAARARLNVLAEELLGVPRWDADGMTVPVATPDPVLAVAADVLAALASAEMSGRRGRLKVCRARECRWVYYDRSPANNSTWCSMDICGARHKMRAYRSRRDAD
ncbi:CGNR zinc finger domain-containing protein [Spiractinospora alimapuensis]|uniref:CGNR zinc finger domain-containing protein n=1 Tax=Spiractinospora alimapuensis TaxID=2820884 RepID=UPI001F3D8C7F|nr:CGNR zinc finger domain-containing protein [Spiractinospora alimapuensis]QVQ52683.1 CGNR zinc finger domain-containing protein [Spiractinospora alimapuensis]